MSVCHRTATMDGHLVAVKTDGGYVAAVAWNDPAIYPANRRGVGTRIYETPYPSPGLAASAAAAQWATDMAADCRFGCMLLVDRDAAPGENGATEKNGTLVVYGVPVPTAWSDPKKIRYDAALQAMAERGLGGNLILCADGSYAATPYEAVRKHMCPGPCSPDCCLYQSVKLPTGRHAKLCDEEAATLMSGTVLYALGARYVKKGETDGSQA